MANSTTLTVRLAPKVKQRLGRLAQQTKRTRSFLAGEAIASYVEQELDIIEGIKHGLDDAKAGRVVSHATAMRRIRAVVGRARKGKKAARRRSSGRPRRCWTSSTRSPVSPSAIRMPRPA
jgi:predicted transcriptional regulator